MPIYDENEPNPSFMDKLRLKKGVDPDVLQRPPSNKTAQAKYDELKALENNQNAINDQLGLGGEKNFSSPSGSANGLQAKQSLFDKAKGLISRNPKKSIGIGATAGLSIGIVTIGLVGLGPLKLMQFANLLQGIHFSDGDVISSQRIRNLVTYSKWLSSPDAAGIESTRLGTVEAFKAKKVDAKLADSGIKSNFDKYGKFTGFDVDPAKMPKDIDNIKDPAKRKAAYAKHFGVDSNLVDFNGKNVKINAPEGTRSIRKLQYQALKISPNINKATAAYSKRILYKRANISYNPITRVKQAAKTKLLEKVDEYKQQRQARYSGEEIDLDVPENRAETSDSDTDPTKDNKRQFDESHKEAEDAVREIDTGDPKEAKLSLKAKVGVAGSGAAAAIGILCTAQQMSGDIADAQLDNKLKAMIDVGAEYVSIDSKMKTGNDIDYETLGFAGNNLESTKNAGALDKDGNLVEGASAVAGSAFDASTILKWQGKEVGGRTLDNDNVADANPDEKANIQKLDAAFEAIEGVQGVGQTLSAVCGLYNTFDNWIGSALSTVTGGLSDKASALFMGPIFNLLTGDAVNALADKYKGAAFGEMASMGFLLMQNETNSSMGQDVLADAQRAELSKYIAEETNYQDDRSFLAKNIDIYNPYSLASSFTISASTFKPSDLLSTPKSLFTSLSHVVSGTTYAEDNFSLTNEDTYGLPKVSIAPALLNDPEFENPFKNAIAAKEALASNPELKKYVQDCRGIEISDDLNFTTKSFDDGAIGAYMKKDCKSEAYMAYSLDNQLLNSGGTKSNIASLLGNLFGQKATAATARPALTVKQKQYAQVMFAATDTAYAKSYSCVEEGDSEACKEIFPEAETNTQCGEPASTAPTGDTSNKTYMPVRNEGAFNSASAHDISVPEGTPVYAIKDGKVTESKDLKGCDGRKCGDGMYSYGRVIKIDHNINGKAPIVYAHLSKRVVESGDQVKAGQIIGYSGNSGNSYGPHLHIDFSGSYTAVDWLKGQKPEKPPEAGNPGGSGDNNCQDGGLAGSKDYTDDTANPIPKGEEVAAQAIKWANNDRDCGFMGGTCKRLCLGIVSELWKSVGKDLVSGDTAWTAYKRYKSNGWVNKTKNIPVGAIMWSAEPGNPGDGHAYTYVGDGKIASNDIKASGKYDIVPADWIETKWNHEFLGWSEWHN